MSEDLGRAVDGDLARAVNGDLARDVNGDLAPLREQIDALDREIVRLLNERARLAIEVGHIKARAGRPVHDAERETEVLRRVREANASGGGPLSDDEVVELYGRIVALTRQLEEIETSETSAR